MKHEVFNSNLAFAYNFNYPTLSNRESQVILAELFEQLLIFDRVIINTSRLNFALYFLIKNVGINTVERLLDSGYIKFLLWTPVLFTGGGKKLDDGKIDESIIFGQPPIAAGSLSKDDLDIEKNIKKALSFFSLNKDRKKIFLKRAINNYIVPDGMEFSSKSADFIVDAYTRNNLYTLNLPYQKEPNQLNMQERSLLLELGHKVLETALLSKYNLKSYENFERYEICKNNINNIGKAYNISDNTTSLFRLENLPDLKELYLSGNIEFDSVFKIRHLSNAKYYRKWINEIGENCNVDEIRSEYLKEIKGINRLITFPEVKFIKNLCLFAANGILGNMIAGAEGTIASFGLGLFETFWLDNYLNGKNPSMFIDRVKSQINSDNQR